MLPSSTPDKHSDASVTHSDPFAVDGKALSLVSRQGDAVGVKASTNANKQPQVKKTFNVATLNRKAARQSHMPPPAQVSNGTSVTFMPPPKNASNETTTRVFKEPVLATNSPRYPPIASAVQSVSSNFSSFDPVGFDSPASFKDQIGSKFDEFNNPRSHTRAEAAAVHSSNTQDHFQEVPTGRTNQDYNDPRPFKRRKVMNEQDRNVPVPQETEERRAYAPENAHSAAETHTRTTETNVHASSGGAKRLPTSAFQKYAKEHSAVFQSRKAHWSTCSMDDWLAGGGEIAEKFAELLAKGISAFETEIDGFAGIEKTFEAYKKGVLDNRDQVLRQTKETIAFACSPFLTGTPANAETTP